MTRPVVEVDGTADAAYVRLSQAVVVRTVACDNNINIDLDEFDVVVGVEVLTIGAQLPLDVLTGRYHVDPRTVELANAALDADGQSAPAPIPATSLDMVREVDSFGRPLVSAEATS
jgi:uncharacterized protein YuzE